MLLERFDRGRAGLGMFRRVELEPVTAAQELIALGPEIGARLGEREVDVEEDGVQVQILAGHR